jgi:hypothetical protein
MNGHTEALARITERVHDAQEVLRRYGYGHHADALDALIPEPPADDEQEALSDARKVVDYMTIFPDAQEDARKIARALDVLERNRHREPITDEVLGAMLGAVYAYERECDVRRGDLSLEVYGHRGASMSDAAPTREGRIAAMRAALEGR